MSKPAKSEKAATRPRNYYSIRPWECRHHKGHSEIVAYVEASGRWETVVDVKRTSGASAEELALFIAQLINDNQKKQSLLHEAMEALELCLEGEGLDFTSEQTADRVVNRIRLAAGGGV